MKHRLNRVDLILLAIVLVLIAGTCVKFLVLDPRSEQADSVKIQYQLRFYGVRAYTRDAFQPGDTLYDDTGLSEVGVITDVTAESSFTTVSYSDGTVHRIPVEDRYDVTLTAEGEAIPGDKGYDTGSCQLLINRSSLYTTKYCVSTGTVVSITEESP